MELSFAPTLTSMQRKHIHAMAEKLKITHFSMGDDHDRHICVSKKATPSPSGHHGPNANVSERRGIDIQGGNGNRNRGNSSGRSYEGGGNGSLGKSWDRGDNMGSFGSSFGSSFGRPRGSFGAGGSNGSLSRDRSYLSSSPGDAAHNNNSRTSSSPTNGFTTPTQAASSHSEILIQPIRQPKGPDGTKGFPSVYRTKRAASPSFIVDRSTLSSTPADEVNESETLTVAS